MFFLKKPTAILLVFLFLISPLSIQAEETEAIVSDPIMDPQSSPSSDILPENSGIESEPAPSTTDVLESTVFESILPSDETIPGTESESAALESTPPSETPNEEVPEDLDSLDSAGDGSSFDEFNKQPTPYSLRAQPDNVYGALVYQYPLSLPPGRRGLGPDLKLIYSSQSGEDVGMFEFGWSVNIPYIERMNKKGTEGLYNTQYFTSSMDGELYRNDTSTTTESYGARNTGENFLKYEFKDLSYWLVTDKSGTTYKFGTSTGSRIDNPSNSTQIFRWMLDEVRDTNGNYIKYEYYKNSGQIYPSRVVYTGNNATDGIFTVDFLREARNQTATSSKAGFLVGTKERIYEIDAKINGTLARKYALSYRVADNGGRRLMGAITETGRDELGTEISLPPTSFLYQVSTSTGWVSNSSYVPPVNFIDSDGFDNGARIVDVNGDALPDIFYARNATSTWVTYVNKGNGNGYQSIDYYYNPPARLVAGVGFNDVGTRIVDINGDGLSDVVVGEPGTSRPVYLNDGAGNWVASSTWYVPSALVTKNSEGVYLDSGWRVNDVNGDGLTDILHSLNGDPILTYLNNGYDWNDTSTASWEMPLYFTGTNAVDEGTRLVDINGDGLLDLLKAKETASSTYINNGAGFN